jgi:hypothetical protein
MGQSLDCLVSLVDPTKDKYAQVRASEAGSRGISLERTYHVTVNIRQPVLEYSILPSSTPTSHP